MPPQIQNIKGTNIKKTTTSAAFHSHRTNQSSAAVPPDELHSLNNPLVHSLNTPVKWSITPPSKIAPKNTLPQQQRPPYTFQAQLLKIEPGGCILYKVIRSKVWFITLALFHNFARFHNFNPIPHQSDYEKIRVSFYIQCSKLAIEAGTCPQIA